MYPKFPLSQSQTNIFLHKNYWKIVHYNKSKTATPDLCLTLNSGLLRLFWKSTLDYLVSKSIILAPKQPLSIPPTPPLAQSPPKHPLPKGTEENRVMGLQDLQGSLETEKLHPCHQRWSSLFNCEHSDRQNWKRNYILLSVSKSKPSFSTEMIQHNWEAASPPWINFQLCSYCKLLIPCSRLH